MANRIGKTLLKMLLVITMMIQPVAVSYAMAKMDHGSHHHAHTASEQAHDGHHMPVTDDSQDDGASLMDDCCNSAACSPVATLDVDVVLPRPNSRLSSFHSPSWKGIALPTEIKPPRTLFS